MDDEEFLDLLKQFPAVRSRDYSENDRALTAQDIAHMRQQEEQGLGRDGPPPAASSIAAHSAAGAGTLGDKKTEGPRFDPEAFWTLLKGRAAQVVSEGHAEQFCAAFRQCHEELLNRVLSLDDVERIARAWRANGLVKG